MYGASIYRFCPNTVFDKAKHRGTAVARFLGNPVAITGPVPGVRLPGRDEKATFEVLCNHELDVVRPFIRLCMFRFGCRERHSLVKRGKKMANRIIIRDMIEGSVTGTVNTVNTMNSVSNKKQKTVEEPKTRSFTVVDSC